MPSLDTTPTAPRARAVLLVVLASVFAHLVYGPAFGLAGSPQFRFSAEFPTGDHTGR